MFALPSRNVVMALLPLLLIPLSLSIVAQAHMCTNQIDVVGLLKDRFLGLVVGGGNRVDQGDIIIPVDHTVISLWKRYYGKGYVNVTSQGIVVEASFEAGNIGYAGVFVKYGYLLNYTYVQARIRVLEDRGGYIELLLHGSWDSGKGGDKPSDTVLMIVLAPSQAKLYVNGQEFSVEKQEEYVFEVTVRGTRASVRVGSTTTTTELSTGNYSYVTLMALSTMPGNSIRFLVENLTICGIETDIPSIPHQEFNPPSIIVNGSATITILLPNGSMVTSIVPVTSKRIQPVSQVQTRATITGVNQSIKLSTTQPVMEVEGGESTSTTTVTSELVVQGTISPTQTLGTVSETVGPGGELALTTMYLIVGVIIVLVVATIVVSYARKR